MAPEALRNPFRSERDAFRLLVIVGVSVAAIVLAAAIGGPWVGVPVALLLLAAAARASYRWLRVSLAEPNDGDGDGGSAAVAGGHREEVDE